MTSKTNVIYAIALAALLASCTGRSHQAVEIQPARIPNVGITPGGTPGGGAQIPINLPSETEMKSYGDTSNMTYMFSYLTVNEQKALSFVGGSAQIIISNLPVGQQGTIVLEIYDGATLKLRCEKANVILNAGTNNNLQLSLTPVTGGSGSYNSGGTGSTDLSINTSFGNATNQPGGSGSSNSGNSGSNSSGGGSSSADPLANWDGKSFLGNAKWTIVPVGS